MAISLGRGLIEGKNKFDLNLIAKNYVKWFESDPFDIGITTRLAFNNVKDQQDIKE